MKIRNLPQGSKKSAIITADIHLLKKPGMWSGRAEIAGDDVFAMQQIVDLARQHDSDLYILGDTLDAVTTLPRPVIVAQSLLEPLATDGHLVRYIQGQHEIVVQAHYENYPWLSVCRGAEHMHACVFDFFGKKAFALDYFPQAFEALNFACIPDDTEVLFLHGTAEEVMGIGFHFSMANVPDHVKYIFAGDYHEPVHHQDEHNRQLTYTGSAWLRSADEPLDKYVLKVEPGSGGELMAERIPLKTRTVLKYSQMKEEQKAGDITLDDALPEPLRKPVVIVDMPIDEEEYARLVENFHLHSVGSVVTDSQFEYINVGDEDDTDEQILEHFVDRRQCESEFSFTLDVIQNSVEDALQRLREKLGISTDDITAEPVAAGNVEINLDGEDEEENAWDTEEEAPF